MPRGDAGGWPRLIALTGLFLTALYVGGVILCAVIEPECYEMLAAVTFSHILVGRVAGITVAYAMHASLATAVAVNFAIETILVLLLYPMFITGWNRLLGIGALDRWVSGARENAERYRPFIEKYGRIGLFVFVWFPFWMTGPIVGSIIGYLMGFRHRTTLAIVLTGTLIAIFCWAYALRYLQHWAFSVDPRGPWAVAALLALLVALGFAIRSFLKR